MLDLLYIGGTVAFFALMLTYVKFCRGLGATTDTEAPRHDD